MHWLLSSDVAKRCDVKPQTVRYWARVGKLKPASVTENGTRLFAETDIEEFLKKRMATTASSQLHEKQS